METGRCELSALSFRSRPGPSGPPWIFSSFIPRWPPLIHPAQPQCHLLLEAFPHPPFPPKHYAAWFSWHCLCLNLSHLWVYLQGCWASLVQFIDLVSKDDTLLCDTGGGSGAWLLTPCRDPETESERGEPCSRTSKAYHDHPPVSVHKACPRHISQDGQMEGSWWAKTMLPN